MAEEGSVYDYSDEILSKVRENFAVVYNQNRDLFDESDFHRLMNDDFWLKRYVRRKRGHAEQSTHFLVEAMKWRKKNDVANMSDRSFPYEFHEVGGIYPFKEDVNGNVVLHVRICLFQRIPAIIELLKKYTIFHLTRADELAARRGSGWILLLDCTNTGFVNSDIEMANFLVSILRNYFPSGQKYILIHNLPWFLNAIKNVVFTMLPNYVKQRIKSSNEQTIHEYIAVENLPDYLGGDGVESYRVIPQGLKTTVQMAEEGVLKLNENDLVKVAKYYEKVRDIIKETK